MPDACLLPFQAKLLDVFQSGQNLQRPIGMYDAVISDANLGTSRAQIELVGKKNLQRGKKAKYQITSVDKSCAAVKDVGDEGTGICDAGTKDPIITTVKTIANHIALENIEISIDDYRDICNFDIPTYIMEQIWNRLDMGMREVNARLGIAACAASGTGGGDIALVNNATNTPYFGALHAVTQKYRKAGINQLPIMVGGDTLDFYKYSQQRSGLDENGANRSQDTLPPIFYDDYLDTSCPVAGRESMLAFVPGSLQFVQYLENVGDFKTNLDPSLDLIGMFQKGVGYEFGTMTDPRTGYIWDASIQYIQCDKKHILQLTSQFDLWNMPISGCYDSNFNGITKWGVCTREIPGCGVSS